MHGGWGAQWLFRFLGWRSSGGEILTCEFGGLWTVWRWTMGDGRQEGVVNNEQATHSGSRGGRKGNKEMVMDMRWPCVRRK